MNQEEFKTQYMGSFEISEKDKGLYELAKFYHEIVDAFDSFVCTSKIKGEPYPASRYERAIIDKHARTVREQCIETGISRGFTREEIHASIKKFHR